MKGIIGCRTPRGKRPGCASGGRDVDLVPVDDQQCVLITRYNEEELEEMEGVDEAWWN